jgi:uncharacterized membrane protein HdeD (DUF308 family)
MTIAVIIALTMNMNWVLGAFGIWAIFSGLLQLGTALRRWKTSGGQWAMVLSGGQSAVAGALFIFQAQMPEEPSISAVAGYAGVGAFYFLVSAIWLSVTLSRRSMRGAELKVPASHGLIFPLTSSAYARNVP